MCLIANRPFNYVSTSNLLIAPIVNHFLRLPYNGGLIHMHTIHSKYDDTQQQLSKTGRGNWVLISFFLTICLSSVLTPRRALATTLLPLSVCTPTYYNLWTRMIGCTHFYFSFSNWATEFIPPHRTRNKKSFIDF